MKMLKIPIEVLQHPILLQSEIWRLVTRRSTYCSARWPISCRRSAVMLRSWSKGGSALIALGLVRRATRDVDLLFAMAEQGGGRHEADLRALSPTPGELAAAARRSTTRAPPPGYRSVLVDALRVLGVNDFAEHGFIRPPPQGPASRTSRTRPFR
jgi:hypothetical protein